jgi:signal recognition particle receptor subunit beta
MAKYLARKPALKSSGRSLQSSETFVSELSFRTSSDVTAQGTVASPARLPQPFQVAPDAGDTRYDTERVLQGLDLPGHHVFEKSTARFSK